MAQKSTTEKQFDAALAQWDAEHTRLMMDRPARRAMFAAWWFIENVPEDTGGRSDVFFRVRELVREANSEAATCDA